MKQLLTLFLALLMTAAVSAQKLNVGDAVMLKGTEKGGYFHPVFSPDGKYLLTTSENYTGLQKHDFRSSRVKVMSKAEGAGYGVRVSNDSKQIFARRYEYNGNVRYTAVERIKARNGKVTTLRKAVQGQQSPDAEAAELYVTIKNKLMVLHSGDTETILAPNGDKESYFWCSVSPDGQHILYCTAHKGTWICRIDGSEPVSLGWINAPVWCGNDRVVGMQDSDDGEHVLSSAIVTVTADGNNFQVLQSGQKIAMYPAASADGRRIAFNNNQGQIFIMEVK